MEQEEDKYMDKYARSLAGQGQKISPEDSDYKEKLIHVVQSFRTFDVAAGLLLQSIGICEKHLEITAYARKQLDLLEHLAEVYHFGRHDEKCQAVLTLLETKISKMNALETLD